MINDKLAGSFAIYSVSVPFTFHTLSALLLATLCSRHGGQKQKVVRVQYREGDQRYRVAPKLCTSSDLDHRPCLDDLPLSRRHGLPFDHRRINAELFDNFCYLFDERWGRGRGLWMQVG